MKLGVYKVQLENYRPLQYPILVSNIQMKLRVYKGIQELSYNVLYAYIKWNTWHISFFTKTI